MMYVVSVAVGIAIGYYAEDIIAKVRELYNKVKGS